MKLFNRSPFPALRSVEPDGDVRTHFPRPSGHPNAPGKTSARSTPTRPDPVEPPHDDPFSEDPFSVPSLIGTGRRLAGLPATRGDMDLVKGVLWHACLVIIDELFEDLATHPDGVRPGQWAECQVLSGLPPRHGDQFNGIFLRRFLTTMVEVVHRLTTGWRSLPTVAHALALRLLLDKAGQLAEIFDVELPRGWRAELERVLGSGIDTDALYTPDAELPQSLAFPAWFTPRNPHEPLPPFIWP